MRLSKLAAFELSGWSFPVWTLSLAFDYDANRFRNNSVDELKVGLMSQSKTAIESSVGSPLTTLSEDEQMFRASVREFAEGELRPRVETMDEQGKLDPALIKQCFDLGLMGIETPEEFGGAGASFFTAILAVEELSRVDASVGVLVDVQNTLVNNALIRWGNQEQKKKYLNRLAADAVGAYALSEAGSGSDAFAMQTRAVDKGDHYLINGRKLWITNGNEAEIFVLFANANPDAGYRGITAFIVEKEFCRILCRQERKQTGHSGVFDYGDNFGRLPSAKRKCAG